jgi:hypothetical protein
MRRKKTLHDLSNVLILLLGFVWGIVAFRRGMPGLFTLSERGLPESLVTLVFGFFGVLPAAVAALWKPAISAVWLGAGFFLIATLVLAEYGLSYAFAASELFLPNLILALGYTYLSFSRPSRPHAS